MKNRLWVESYRPQTIADYVFVNERQKNQVEGWVKDGSIPHLLLSGDPGTGKTTLAKVLIHELAVSEYDVLEINASRENSVDVVRNKIVNFVQTMPFGNFKVVLLDEADYLTPAGQVKLATPVNKKEHVYTFGLDGKVPVNDMVVGAAIFNKTAALNRSTLTAGTVVATSL